VNDCDQNAVRAVVSVTVNVTVRVPALEYVCGAGLFPPALVESPYVHVYDNESPAGMFKSSAVAAQSISSPVTTHDGPLVKNGADGMIEVTLAGYGPEYVVPFVVILPDVNTPFVMFAFVTTIFARLELTIFEFVAFTLFNVELVTVVFAILLFVKPEFATLLPAVTCELFTAELVTVLSVTVDPVVILLAAIALF
jgi:hypothetical protein